MKVSFDFLRLLDCRGAPLVQNWLAVCVCVCVYPNSSGQVYNRIEMVSGLLLMTDLLKAKAPHSFFSILSLLLFFSPSFCLSSLLQRSLCPEVKPVHNDRAEKADMFPFFFLSFHNKPISPHILTFFCLSTLSPLSLPEIIKLNALIFLYDPRPLLLLHFTQSD